MRHVGIMAVVCALSLQGCRSPEKVDYVEAMRSLVHEMAEWEAYTQRTGSTAEGAAGFAYSTTLGEVAGVGDAQWGAILDDPDIPYEYKTDLIFEILETRLGKGAVYIGNEDNIIVPRWGPIDLDKAMIELPAPQKQP